MRYRRMMGVRWACALCFSSVTALIATTALVSCSSDHDSAALQKGASGQAQVVGLALTKADVATVTVTITGGPADAGVFVLNLGKSSTDGTWSGVISGIPAGSGYTFTMAARDSAGNVVYQGTATSVTVTANQTVQVLITGQQATPNAATTNAAPVIDSALVSSVQVAPGDTVALLATAHDPNPGDTLTYSWTANAGTFSSASSSATSWSAPSTVGTDVITLTVQDQSGAAVQVQMTVSVKTSNATGSANVMVGLNTWPVVASVTGTPNYLVKGTPTDFTVLASDPDGDPISYAWASSCSGTFTNTQVPTPRFTLATDATDTSCTVSVIVSDNRGGSSTGSLTVPVGRPTTAISPSITQSLQSAQRVGSSSDSVTLRVNATDPQGLPLTFSWAANGGTLGTPDSSSGSSQVVWTPPSSAAASWLITATVTDSAGVSATKTFTVKPSGCFGTTPPASSAWSWGFMADTQWIGTDDGKNPSSVAVDIINQLNTQFIAKGVKFVVAAGDITDNGATAALDTRAEFTQALYNAGIGFYPLRGNHESSAAAATEFKRVFPQTQTSQHNATPNDSVYPNLLNADDPNTHPVAKAGSVFTLGTLAAAPSGTLAPLAGLTYAFDYGNARIVMLDGFTPSSGSAFSIGAQQAWITSTLQGKPSGAHAFVFGHKGIITENHVDTLFGSTPAAAPADQDAFIASLQTNGVRYLVGGHDHMHNRAIVTTTDGTTASVQNIIAASDSSKFYIPANPSNDDKYDLPAPSLDGGTGGFGRRRETPIAQELNTVGYYVVTIDGIKASVDFYSADANPTLSSGEYLISTTPPLNFTKRETFGYGTNGKQFVVAQGQSYASVQDAFGATTAKILSGTNASTNVEGGGRHPVKTVDTGWTNGDCSTSSAILSLWITASTLGVDQTDTYVLSITYDPTGIAADQVASGTFGLATRNASGSWVNAVSKDFGGTKTFVQGPWQASYGLGTYGVDPATNTAWAVINHSSDFAVASFSPTN